MNKLPIPIYGGYLEIYDTPDELQSSYPQHDFGAWGAGFTAGIVSDGCSTIVMQLSIIDANTITHESIHAAFDILHFSGVPINYDNNETICYLAGWVAEQLECHYKGNSNE
ncbi:hypothetical protein AB7080_12120 [Providencia rettgeri]